MGVLTKGGNAGAKTDTHGESTRYAGAGRRHRAPRRWENGLEWTLPGAPETSQARTGGGVPLDGEPAVFCCSVCSIGEARPSKRTPQLRPSSALRPSQQSDATAETVLCSAYVLRTLYARHGSNHK